MNPGVLMGLSQASETLRNISLEKEKLKRENDAFDVDMKIKKLKIQQLENELDPDRYRKILETLQNASKVQKAQRTAKESILENSRSDILSQFKGLQAYGQGMLQGRAEYENELQSQELQPQGEVDTPERSYMDVSGIEIDPIATLKGDFPFREVSRKDQKLRSFEDDVKAGMGTDDLKKKYPLLGDEIKKIEDVRGEGPDSIYKGTAEWKTKDAQGTLFSEWLKSLQGSFEESFIERKTPAKSKNDLVENILNGQIPGEYLDDKGEILASKLLNKLNKTSDDFYSWALENHPDLARMAFPGKSSIK